MDEIKREFAEKKEKEAEEKHAQKLRELQDSASGKKDEAIRHGQTQHLNNLKKIINEQKTFVNYVNLMKEEDAEQHKDKIVDLVRKAEEKLAKIECDPVIKSTLDNLEEKIEGTKKAKAKSDETELIVRRQIFEEVNAQLDKNEQLTEKRQEEMRNQHAAILDEEQNVLATERAESKRIAEESIAKIRSDLVEQQKMGTLNIAIQKFTDERKSRKHINDKINESKALLEDLDKQFMDAYKVLNASPEIYKKLRPKHKRATRGHLRRFIELLTAVSSKLNEIEQNLASFEWEDVKMTELSRQIKTQISSLRKIIANLNLILELDDVEIDPKITEEFVTAKQTLFQQINNMDVISEQRSRVVQVIQQRREETMPDVAKLSIEN